MPGYVIHLAIGKVYAKNNNIKDLKSFENGIIDPDLTDDKSKTHYGPYSSKPGLNRFLSEHGIKNEYDEGYFLHLITDYLFYNRFLKRWDESIYEDYDILNRKLQKEYDVKITEDMTNIVKSKRKELSILDEDEIHVFIETVGRIDFKKMINKKDEDFEEQLNNIKFIF